MIVSKKISDLKVGDTVIGPAGPVKITNVIEKYIPTRMFLMKFSIGKVKCSGDHLWSVYIDGENSVLTAIEIFSLYKRKNMKFGTEDGPNLNSIKEIKPEEVCCIDIESDDKLFKLDLEGGSVFTHNCQFRAACGRLGSIASMMLFGNTMATTIDGSHPGAGMISANGSISSIQYYYEGIEWIQSFYKKCGYDDTGHRKKSKSNNAEQSRSTDIPQEALDQMENGEDIEDFTIDFGDIGGSEESENSSGSGEKPVKPADSQPKSEEDEYLEDLDSIFDFQHDIATIEIEGISGEVDKTKRQKFE